MQCTGPGTEPVIRDGEEERERSPLQNKNCGSRIRLCFKKSLEINMTNTGTQGQSPWS